MVVVALEWSHKERENSANSSRVEENALWISGVGGQSGQTGWKRAENRNSNHHWRCRIASLNEQQVNTLSAFSGTRHWPGALNYTPADVHFEVLIKH